MSTNTILATTPLVSTNYLLRATGTTIGNSLIFDNGTNVGIGNTNTSYTLDVSGTVRGTTSAYFATASGSVGIGTTSTGFNVAGLPLVVGSGSGNTGMTIFSGNASSGSIHFADTVTTGDGSFAGFINYSHTTNSMQFGTTGATPLERMRITSGGNVCIGMTTAPYGIVSIKSNNTSAYYGLNVFANGNANFTYVNHDNSVGIIGTEFGVGGSHTPLTFQSGGSERMRITSGGNVLVGTTDDTGNYKFKTSGVIAAMGSNSSLLFQNRSSTNTYEWYATGGIIYVYAGSNILQINGTTGVYTPLSDINKKKDFEISEIGLDAIMGLKPTLYRMKSDDTEGNKELGFIAQEVKDFIPQAYVESGEGKDIFIGLNYNAIVAALVNGMQEQQALITSLQEQINELKNK
jgi:hypothetical protein